VAHPLIFVGIDVKLGAERMTVELTLGARVDDVAFGTCKGAAVERPFDNIRIEKRAQLLEQPADARDQREVAAEAVVLLDAVVDGDQQQRDPQQ